MRGLVFLAVVAICPAASGCAVAVGVLAGAALCQGVDEPDRRDCYKVAVPAGAAIGLVYEIHVRNEQKVLAAREDTLTARAFALEQRADELDAYNQALQERVWNLQRLVQEAKAHQYTRQNAIENARAELAEHQRHAREQYQEVTAALESVHARMQQLDRRAPDFGVKYSALDRQRRALIGARGLLHDILTIYL